MKQVKFNKEMKKYFELYHYSTKYTLRDAYSSFSLAKQEAFEYCEQIRKEKQIFFQVSNGKIITASKFVFTYGFVYWDEDNKKHFALITPSKELDAIVEE